VVGSCRGVGRWPSAVAGTPTSERMAEEGCRRGGYGGGDATELDGGSRQPIESRGAAHRQPSIQVSWPLDLRIAEEVSVF
jgi:hypothetical protein